MGEKIKLRKLISKIDDKMGNPMIYSYQKTLLKLTGVLIIALMFVIRGSTVPMLTENKILRLLFYSAPYGDKTLYNIGISVIAAYIFYIFQVYIPEHKKFKSNCAVFSANHQYLIYLLNQYTLAWEKFLGKKQGECCFYEFSYRLNHRESGAVTKKTYNETIAAIPDTFERIIQHIRFDDCDIAYREFIRNSYYIISNRFKFMDDQFPRWSDVILEAKDYELLQQMVIDDIKRIQRRISSIENYRVKVESVGAYEKSKIQEISDKI